MERCAVLYSCVDATNATRPFAYAIEMVAVTQGLSGGDLVTQMPQKERVAKFFPYAGARRSLGRKISFCVCHCMPVSPRIQHNITSFVDLCFEKRHLPVSQITHLNSMTVKAVGPAQS